MSLGKAAVLVKRKRKDVMSNEMYTFPQLTRWAFVAHDVLGIALSDL